MKARVAADYRRLSDEELVHKYIQKKEHFPISILFERYGHLVYGVCSKYAGGSTARQLTEQVFISMLGQLPDFQEVSFRKWLLAYTYQHCGTVREAGLPDSDDAFWGNDQVNWDAVLDAYVTSLPSDQRRCLELFYKERKTHQEISRMTGKSLNKVCALLQDARRNIWMKLEALEEVK